MSRYDPAVYVAPPRRTPCSEFSENSNATPALRNAFADALEAHQRRVSQSSPVATQESARDIGNALPGHAGEVDSQKPSSASRGLRVGLPIPVDAGSHIDAGRVNATVVSETPVQESERRRIESPDSDECGDTAVPQVAVTPSEASTQEAETPVDAPTRESECTLDDRNVAQHRPVSSDDERHARGEFETETVANAGTLELMFTNETGVQAPVSEHRPLRFRTLEQAVTSALSQHWRIDEEGGSASQQQAWFFELTDDDMVLACTITRSSDAGLLSIALEVDDDRIADAQLVGDLHERLADFHDRAVLDSITVVTG